MTWWTENFHVSHASPIIATTSWVWRASNQLDSRPADPLTEVPFDGTSLTDNSKTAKYENRARIPSYRGARHGRKGDVYARAQQDSAPVSAEPFNITRALQCSMALKTPSSGDGGWNRSCSLGFVWARGIMDDGYCIWLQVEEWIDAAPIEPLHHRRPLKRRGTAGACRRHGH